jgi:hypothetical protein
MLYGIVFYSIKNRPIRDDVYQMKCRAGTPQHKLSVIVVHLMKDC